MADFCKKCSERLFGFDGQDLAGLITEEKVREGFGRAVICEGCGPTLVNHLGECILPDCDVCNNTCNIKDHNPVHQHKDGKWWFYDETWSREYGPYETEKQAKELCLIMVFAPQNCPECGGESFCIEDGHIICETPGTCTWSISIEDAAKPVDDDIPF